MNEHIIGITNGLLIFFLGLMFTTVLDTYIVTDVNKNETQFELIMNILFEVICILILAYYVLKLMEILPPKDSSNEWAKASMLFFASSLVSNAHKLKSRIGLLQERMTGKKMS